MCNIKQVNASLPQNLFIFGKCSRSDIDVEASGEGVQSFRTLDRASSHFSAGDAQEIKLKKVNSYNLICHSFYNYCCFLYALIR